MKTEGNKETIKQKDNHTVLTQVNGQAVKDVAALLNRIAQTNPRDEAKVSLLRKGKEIT